MSKLNSAISRRRSLAPSALAGAVGAFLPATPAHVETGPAATAGAAAKIPVAITAFPDGDLYQASET